MRFELIIDKEKEECVSVRAHEKSELTNAIEELVTVNSTEIFGYGKRETVVLTPSKVCCFTIEDNCIYAFTEQGKYRVKQRLYQLENTLGDAFIKINQSCLVNVKAIARFDASLSGALRLRLKNGYTDYVSRRNIKRIKERLGL